MPTSVKQISFLKYNNYANRVTHPGDTFSDIFGEYSALTGMYANEIARINEPKLWNPNDGITATIVTPNGVDFSTEPDYLVVWFTVSDQIESRWFITETVRLHAGQYQCYLRRDVFSEAWNELTSATCNIDRAILNKYNKLIFNPEPTTVNQIIEQEIELKDKTGCPWIVFYCNNSEFPSGVSVEDYHEYDFLATGTTTAQDYCDDHEFEYLSDNEHDIQINFSYERYSIFGEHEVSDYKRFKLLPYGLNVSGPSATYSNSFHSVNMNIPLEFTDEGGVPNIVEDVKDLIDIEGSDDYVALYNKYNNKVLKAENKYYRLSVTYSDYNAQVDRRLTTSAADSDVLSDAMSILENKTNFTSARWSGSGMTGVVANNFCLSYVTRNAVITPTEITDYASTDVQLPAAAYDTFDSPYGTYAMPYGNIKIKWNTEAEITTNKDLNMAAAVTIAEMMSTTAVYDIQILPFCPLPNQYITNDGKINIGNNPHLTDANTMKKGGTTVGYIFSLPNVNFSRQILLDSPITIDDPKVDGITKMYRLYAPNYSSSFEFSAAKNNGLIGFTISCTYLPIQPYIRVSPIWGGLYGSADFNRDPRGLILGGDYSIARVQNSWVNYQEQQKNFQALFNRQIQNMDVMREIQVEQERWGVGAGVLQGATSGALAGSVAGPWGAVAGGLVGAAGSVATGVRDIELSQKAYQESRSYATDVHNMQLQNVRAMPVGLARTTAFNNDNRYFPILTVYNCTDDEMRQVLNFIRNRSMTVGAIGQPSEYLSNDWSYTFGGDAYTDRGFIQGSIININTVHDTHFVDALNDEFRKGVYTK